MHSAVYFYKGIMQLGQENNGIALALKTFLLPLNRFRSLFPFYSARKHQKNRSLVMF